MLAEVPSEEKASTCVVRPTEPVRLTGSCVKEVDVYCSEPPCGRWLTDDGVPGVYVVEGPVVEGKSKVLVALDPGAQLTIGGSCVPQTIVEQSAELLAP